MDDSEVVDIKTESPTAAEPSAQEAEDTSASPCKQTSADTKKMVNEYFYVNHLQYNYKENLKPLREYFVYTCF